MLAVRRAIPHTPTAGRIPKPARPKPGLALEEIAMTSRTLLAVAGAALCLLSGAAAAAGETTYGSQLMTPQERIEHRNALRSRQTDAAREAYRSQQHERMQAPAQEQGARLPETPPARGAGANRRAAGMGPRGAR